MINFNTEFCPSSDQKSQGGPLGIDAKSSTPRRSWSPAGVNPETGEICSEKSDFDPVLVRLERFALQSVARKLLRGSTVKRVNNCLRVAHNRSEINVFRSKEHKTCSFSGLQTCSSVWSCPVCASKISERRRKELQQAISHHKANGGDVLLLTLTTPHYLADKLFDVLVSQRQALVNFNAGENVTRFNKSIGLIGQIRAFEVTHGRLRAVNNGWHPHYHILLFTDSCLNLDHLRPIFFDRWLRACLKSGLPAPSLKHGITLENGDYAAAYASKWGLESEMTKGHIKKSKNGETPFDLLRSVLHDQDRQAAALYREFSEVFKGKRQLYWSQGLKARFDLSDISDDVLSAQIEDDAFILGSIEADDWLLILKNDLRGEILELARYGWEPVQRLITSLRGG